MQLMAITMNSGVPLDSFTNLMPRMFDSGLHRPWRVHDVLNDGINCQMYFTRK